MNKKEIVAFEQVVECGCGMDVHKDLIVATIQGKGIKTQTKSYKTFTSSLSGEQRISRQEQKWTHYLWEQIFARSFGRVWLGFIPEKNTYMSAKYKSMVGRRGKKKTIIALGHKILIATYFIIKDRVAYNELGPDHQNNFRKDRLIAYYKRQLEKLEAA